MLNNIKKNYKNYRNIRIISDNCSSADSLSELLDVSINTIVSISRADYLHDSQHSQCADLVVIDIDSQGSADTSYLCFLATCFYPATPVVLVTEHALSVVKRGYFLSAGAYDVISLSDSASLATNH